MNTPHPNPHHTSLTSLTQLLHLAHHRNKNQHRLSKWYISFGILRRQVSRLLLLTPEFVIDGQGKSRAKVKGKAKERKEREERELQGLIRFIGERVVPGCYLAFSQLVADNQYAPLGLMLMGCLARLYKILGALKVPTPEEIADASGVMKEISSSVSQTQEPEIGEDLGEKIVREVHVVKLLEDKVNQRMERNEDDGIERQSLKAKKRKQESDVSEEKEDDDDSTALQKSKSKKRKLFGDVETSDKKTSKISSSDATPAKPPKKKRKRKGGDVIDDLFASLM